MLIVFDWVPEKQTGVGEERGMETYLRGDILLGLLWEGHTCEEVGCRGGMRGQRGSMTCVVDAADFLADSTGKSGAGWCLRCLKLRQGCGAFLFCHCLVIGHR